VSESQEAKKAMINFEGRRLTGANFFCDEPAAIVDAEIPADKAGEVIHDWQQNVKALHQRLHLSEPIIGSRIHSKGQSLYFTAPIDSLYSAIELNETALLVALGIVKVDDTVDEIDGITHVQHLEALFIEEANPTLLELQSLAKTHEVPFLWDDDFVSLGLGRHCQTWDIDELPDPGSVDWPSFRQMPIAFITGTNGKSTTTRLCAQILRGARLTIGFSSTDGIWAGDDCLDTGDYSGPGGAREVLRNNQVDAAILEVARGGLLRRGLGTGNAQVALITNVAEDHLGEYGVNTLEELIEAKFIVRKSLGRHGTLILNADDAGMVEFTSSLNMEGQIIWFSLDRENPVISQHLASGGVVFCIADECINRIDKNQKMTICAVDAIPITLSGAARYNVANALAASALCWQILEGTIEERLLIIADGLKAFDGNRDNPGRGNLRIINDISVMVDFAHNPHGLNAVVDTLLQLPAKNRMVMLGHAGDRSIDEIRELTRVALRLDPQKIIVYELEEYLRGRELGEVPNIIIDALTEFGFAKEHISLSPNPGAGASQALAMASAGDFLLLLTLGDRTEVFEVLDKFAADGSI
jgi:UDP-N-acetylmuramyl tripeptide synthase